MVRNQTIKHILRAKAIMLVLLIAASGAFATLGDGKVKTTAKKKPLLSKQQSVSVNSRTFSIKSGYNFRGNRVIRPEQPAEKFITLKSEVTYQRGVTTYKVPVQKKVLLGGNLKVSVYASGGF